MNTSSKQNASNDAAKDVEQNQKPTRLSGSSNGAPNFTNVAPKTAAQEEVVHQVTAKEAVKPKPAFTPIPAKDSVPTPLLAAKGDDDVMSQQGKPS